MLDKRKINLLLFFFLFALVGVGYMILNPFINHPKFYQDSLMIVNSSRDISIGAGSYKTTSFLLAPITDSLDLIGANIYSYGQRYDLGFFFTNGVYMILFLIPMMYIWMKKMPKLNVINVFCFLVMFGLYSAFYGVPNKDFIPFVFSFISLLFYFKGFKKTSILLLVVLMSYYAALGRFYYALFAVCLILHLTIKRKSVLFILYGIGIALCYVMFNTSVFQYIYLARPSNNIDITNTWIDYPLNDHVFSGFILNRVLELVRLFFPVELLIKSVNYIPFVVFQLVTTVVTFKVLRNKKDYNPLEVVSALVVLTFTISQAIFEPDFGSYFRHKISIFPFIYILIRSHEYNFKFLRKKSPEKKKAKKGIRIFRKRIVW
ncbi:hypothetical protein [Priestia megaterium]|uniref:hypothetical protein n=1 Tax=Priestia megaterium TaxID=1404 RepID=UPI000BF26B0A|nr:hypothetical protein [Priestia megaterium]PFR93532.1 hypothetical protein COK39_17735 [Priestia megaterium]